MTAFNWDKMNRTPQGNLVRKEAEKRGAMSLDERAGSYEKQAHKHLREHSSYSELVKDIKNHIEKLIHEDDSKKEDVARDIAKRHEKTILNDKEIEGESEQIAYVLALAKALKSEEPRLH